MSPLITGIGIGLAIAAPVGPIGLLCIRRSLSQARAAGLATGLGAASADAVYGVLAAAGLSMTGWLVDHARVMQAGGGGAWLLVVGVFAGSAMWWLFLVQMALSARTFMTADRLRWLDFASGAVLTVWGIQIAVSGLV